jgi:hypothetical protein
MMERAGPGNACAGKNKSGFKAADPKRAQPSVESTWSRAGLRQGLPIKNRMVVLICTRASCRAEGGVSARNAVSRGQAQRGAATASARQLVVWANVCTRGLWT